MKSIRYACTFLCLCAVALSAQIHGGEWSAPAAIARGSAPRLAVDPNDGSMHVAFIGYNGYWSSLGMQYARLGFQDGAVQTLSLESVPGGAGDLGYWQGGTAIAVDSESNPHLLVRRHSQFGVFSLYYRTRSQSSGWTDDDQPLKSDVLRAYSMDMAFDAGDVLHFGWCEKLDEWHDGFYAQIRDGSLTQITSGFNGTRWDNGMGLAVTPGG